MRKTCTLLLLLVIPIVAGTITKTITISESALRFTQVDNYDVVNMPYEHDLAVPGNPLLPAKSIYFLIPSDADIVDIEIISKQDRELDGSYNIHPAQNPVPFSRPDLREFTPPNELIYASDQPYPVNTLKSFGTGLKSGFRIAGLELYPLHYIPSAKKLVLTESITLKVEYEKNRHPVSQLSQTQYDVFSKEVAKLVCNAEDIVHFAPSIRRSIDDINYVIITTSSYATGFQSLADWRTKQGWKAEIITTSWIYSNYSGYDNQERIRNFLIDYFNNEGLVWAFIGGDNNVVPVREAYLPFSGDSYISTDLYYSDLDGTWDQNGNHLYGEMSGDGVDLYSDIFVGRLCCASTANVSNYLTKQNTFEKNPPTSYLRKMLLPSVLLWPGYHGSQTNGYIADTTPAGWFDCALVDPPNYRMRDSLNQGYQFCHPMAHGDEYGFYSYYGSAIFHRSQIASLSNGTNYNIMNSIACYSGDFDETDCLAESLVNKYPGACVATIMNTRYGWGQPPSMGPSERLDLMFYGHFFNRDTLEIGRCHARSKDYYVGPMLGQTVWRYCGYELTLFGDPALPMWGDIPVNPVVTHPDTVAVGSQSVNVTVTRSGSPVSNALVCLYKNGEVHERGYTNASGQASIFITTSTAGTMSITVTAKDCYPYEGTIQVYGSGSTVPYIVLVGYEVVGGNGNGMLDPGEDAGIVCTIANIGTDIATNTTGTLRSSSGYITITDSTATYGTMQVQDTLDNTSDPYDVSVSASCPPGTSVDFDLYIACAESSWTESFSLIVGIQGQDYVTHDCGNIKFTVTRYGALGFMSSSQTGGSGLWYPVNTTNHLYYGAFAAGTDVNYCVDRYYESGSDDTDWETTVNPDGMARMFEPGPNNIDEYATARYDDSGHPSPQGLVCAQYSWAWDDATANDFVIMKFALINEGSSTINDLYATIFMDVDFSGGANDQGSSEAARNLVWMYNSTPYVGAAILDPPRSTSAVNLSLIDHAIYVYPYSGLPDNVQIQFMDGTVQNPSSDRPYDWSICTSAGPFTIAPGAAEIAAFAILGGTNLSDIQANCDTAYNRYWNWPGVEETPGSAQITGIHLYPVISRGRPYKVAYGFAQETPVQVKVYDALGRLVVHEDYGRLNGSGEFTFDLKSLAQGVYFVKIDAEDKTTTSKIIWLK